jgi:mannose-1-phosphate guanylyltransferase
VNFHVVVPAGGSGTRLWPLSRAANPKFLQPLTGERSLLQSTYDRLVPLAGPDRVMVVTGASHAAAVARQLEELPVEQIVAEPSPRDSCGAIGLAAALIEQRDPGAVMASFAADHVIVDTEQFAETVRLAVRGAEAGKLMTIGITPTHPETGYGYVHCGEPAEIPGILSVRRFREKPDRVTAQSYLDSGEYLWNASMFIWRTDVMLAELRRQRPDIHARLVTIAESWDTPERDAVMEREWAALPKIAIEYAVVEGAAERGMVATVPGDFGWFDVGDFDALGQLADDSVAVLGNPDPRSVLSVESERMVIVPSSGRLVATLGLRDVIVVDTPDVVLVCPRDRAQGVKQLVEDLRNRGQTEYI